MRKECRWQPSRCLRSSFVSASCKAIRLLCNLNHRSQPQLCHPRSAAVPFTVEVGDFGLKMKSFCLSLLLPVPVTSTNQAWILLETIVIYFVCISVSLLLLVWGWFLSVMWKKIWWGRAWFGAAQTTQVHCEGTPQNFWDAVRSWPHLCDGEPRFNMACVYVGWMYLKHSSHGYYKAGTSLLDDRLKPPKFMYLKVNLAVFFPAL